MNRIIKFRGFHKPTGKMIDLKKITPLALDAGLKQDGLFLPFLDDVELMQFAGHQIAGVDVYEGDMVRLEENDEGADPFDQITYYVVTWINEWSMFALLRVEDEYREYVERGAKELDASMFWTFPLELNDTKSSKHYLCGNIFEHPELLTPNTKP